MNYQRVPVNTNYSNFMIPYLYLYRAGVTGFGDPFEFGNATDGYVLFKKNVRYDVETRILMNTVSGPFDTLGNGYGNADGVVEYWVNGIKEFTWTGVIRHHTNIKAMGWWHARPVPSRKCGRRASRRQAPDWRQWCLHRDDCR